MAREPPQAFTAAVWRPSGPCRHPPDISFQVADSHAKRSKRTCSLLRPRHPGSVDDPPVSDLGSFPRVLSNGVVTTHRGTRLIETAASICYGHPVTEKRGVSGWMCSKRDLSAAHWEGVNTPRNKLTLWMVLLGTVGVIWAVLLVGCAIAFCALAAPMVAGLMLPPHQWSIGTQPQGPGPPGLGTSPHAANHVR